MSSKPNTAYHNHRSPPTPDHCQVTGWQNQQQPQLLNIVTPPHSPACLTAQPSESSSQDDAILAERRRQRRESKERRRRRDQRSLTVRMEQCVPPWVYSRLRTRHSGSKVNGGGRATNAVISGACIWLRVQERALKEEVGNSQPGKGRWVELVDEEAAALDNWSFSDDDRPIPAGVGLDESSVECLQ